MWCCLMSDFEEALKHLQETLGELDSGFLNFRQIDAATYLERSERVERLLRNWLVYMDEDLVRADDHYNPEVVDEGSLLDEL